MDREKTPSSAEWLQWLWTLGIVLASRGVKYLLSPPHPTLSPKQMEWYENANIVVYAEIIKCIPTKYTSQLRHKGKEYDYVYNVINWIDKDIAPSSTQRIWALKQSLYEMKIEGGESVTEFLVRLDSVREQIIHAGGDDPVVDSDLIHRIISILPSSWETFRQTYLFALAHKTTPSPTYSEFREQLEAEELRLKVGSDGLGKTDIAFRIRENKQRPKEEKHFKKFPTSARKGMWCKHCSMDNHTDATCGFLHPELRKKPGGYKSDTDKESSSERHKNKSGDEGKPRVKWDKKVKEKTTEKKVRKPVALMAYVPSDEDVSYHSDTPSLSDSSHSDSSYSHIPDFDSDDSNWPVDTPTHTAVPPLRIRNPGDVVNVAQYVDDTFVQYGDGIHGIAANRLPALEASIHARQHP